MQRLERDLLREGQSAEPGIDSRRSRGGRRAAGAYFTPEPLVEFVVSEALRARLASAEVAWRDDGSPELIVLDPAAGDGRFLVCARRLLVALAVSKGFDADSAERAISQRCLIGIERDETFAAAARQAIGPGAVIHCREALLGAPADLPPADLVVGNPPYQRSIHFSQTDESLWSELRGKLAATSYGEWDLYAAFLERALDWIGPHGHVGLVVPSRWLTAAFAKKLRQKFAAAGSVRAVVDFGAAQLFDGATTYVSVVFLSAQPSEHVTVAKHGQSEWRCGPIPTTSLDESPWRLTTGKRRTLLNRLSNAAPSLGDVARIVKGAGTNADRVYVFDRPAADTRDDEVDVLSKALGETVRIESALLRPCLRGRDVTAFGSVGDVRVLVPYSRRGVLIEPQQLRERWPRTALYLDRCRDLLERRERGRFRGPNFYCWGRPQNMAFLGEPGAKLVVPDIARNGRALMDTAATMALDSAYALRLADTNPGYSLDLLLAVLNSPIVALWLSETGIPLRGNYMRMKTAYLRSLPLPAMSPLTDDVIAAVQSKEVDPLEVDELVRRAYAIPAADWIRR